MLISASQSLLSAIVVVSFLLLTFCLALAIFHHVPQCFMIFHMFITNRRGNPSCLCSRPSMLDPNSLFRSCHHFNFHVRSSLLCIVDVFWYFTVVHHLHHVSAFPAPFSFSTICYNFSTLFHQPSMTFMMLRDFHHVAYYSSY